MTVNRVYRAVMAILVGCFTILFLFVLFSNPYLQNKYINRAIVFGLMLVFSFILFWGYRLLRKHRQYFTTRRTIMILVVLLTLFFVLQLLFVKSAYVLPSWDFGAVYGSVKAVVCEGKSLQDLPQEQLYFTKFPNNAGIFLILSGILKGLQIIGFSINSSNVLWYCLVINCIFIQIALWLAVTIFIRMKRNHDAILLAFLLMGGMVILLYCPIFYTDTLSMFVPLLLFHLILSYERRPLIRYAVGFMAVSLVGYLIKLTSVFVIFAYVVFFVLKVGKEKLRRNIRKWVPFFLSILAFVVLLYPINGKIQKELGITDEMQERYQFPYTHWVMMGMYEQKDRAGGYFLDAYTYTEQFETKKEKSDRNIEKIGEIVKDRGVKGEITFLLHKGVYTWGDGLFFSVQKLMRGQQNPDGIFRFLWDNEEAHEQEGISYYTTVFWYSVLLFVILSFWMVLFNKRVSRLDILRISIMGLAVFLLIWETRSRYLVAYLPILYIVAVDGMKQVYNRTQKRRLL